MAFKGLSGDRPMRISGVEDQWGHSFILPEPSERCLLQFGDSVACRTHIGLGRCASG